MYTATKHFISNIKRSTASNVGAKFDSENIGVGMAYSPFGIYTNIWNFVSKNDFTAHTVHNVPVRFDYGKLIPNSTKEMILTVVFPRNVAYIAPLIKVNDEIEFDVKLTMVGGVYVCDTILNVYHDREYTYAVTLPTIVTEKLSDIVRF